MSSPGGGYPSDLTDEQWALVEPLLPSAGGAEPSSCHRVKYQYAVGHGAKSFGSCRQEHPLRTTQEIASTIRRRGCFSRRPPTLERIHDALRGKVREADGRDAEPSAGLIDSQSVRTADTVPVATRGFDAGKKVKGRKRFIVTDTLGLLLSVHVVAASIQDRDGAKRPLLWTRLDHPGVRKVWADQGFAGRLGEWTAQIRDRDLEIVRKATDQRGFQVQPKRWAVERTFSWLKAHRRLARDYGTNPTHSETMIRWAMIGVMVRRLTRGRPATRPGPGALSRAEVCGLNRRVAEGPPLTS
ncbi:IS5 family transposase [Streptomyces sp. NPDC096013]|uniref:IS5 family transposase n=1 Tax=Streptomyces sp. NPDC096013 TaxID=3366069 RepID=UPI0037F3C2EF